MLMLSLSDLTRGLMKLPGWARKVKALRISNGHSQSEFGDKCSVSAMTVSRWERGEQEPTARQYVELGNLSHVHGDCWYYWERAGLKRELLRVAFERKIA
jgi:transcriptional regulator with XRE-family HTH domain